MARNVFMGVVYCVAAAVIACAGGCRGVMQSISRAKVTSWNFEKEKTGFLPRGWEAAETSGKCIIGKWEVIKDKSFGGKAIALVDTKNTGRTFNLLMAKGTDYKDVEISVDVRAISGTEDQGGGPIWMAQDPNNYYIARWNPLENNFRVYFVKDGRRKQIANADITVEPKEWHKITIRQKGERIEASLDDKKLIEVTDPTFERSGMIGLWTKADAATAFDNIEVKELK